MVEPDTYLPTAEEVQIHLKDVLNRANQAAPAGAAVADVPGQQ